MLRISQIGYFRSIRQHWLLSVIALMMMGWISLAWHRHSSATKSLSVSLIAEWVGVSGQVSWTLDGLWLLVEQPNPDGAQVLRYDPSEPLASPCAWQGRLNQTPQTSSGYVLTHEDNAIWLWNIETCERLIERSAYLPAEIETAYPWTTRWHFTSTGDCAVALNAMNYSRSLSSARLHIFSDSTARTGFCTTALWRSYAIREIVLTDTYALWIDVSLPEDPPAENTQLRGVWLTNPSAGMDFGEYCETELCDSIGQNASTIALMPQANRIAVGTSFGAVQFIELDVPASFDQIDTSSGYTVQAIQFSTNGQKMAVRGMRYDLEESLYIYNLTIWDVARKKLIQYVAVPGHMADRELLSFALNASGRLLALGYRQRDSGLTEVEIIDPESMAVLQTFRGVSHFAWSPTEAGYLAVVDDVQNILNLWSLYPNP